MEYRKLGKTGWNVSVIGYGAAPLGGVYGKLNIIVCATASDCFSQSVDAIAAEP